MATGLVVFLLVIMVFSQYLLLVRNDPIFPAKLKNAVYFIVPYTRRSGKRRARLPDWKYRRTQLI